MRWDREKLPEPNLHVYGEDDTKIMIYNIRRWPKKGRSEKPREKSKIKKHIAKGRTLDSRLNYLGYADDDFYISYS